MVVGTPDVDDFVVTSLKLLKMVGNIRSKIGVKIFDLAINDILRGIKTDLSEFGVEYQQWFCEQTLVDSGTKNIKFFNSLNFFGNIKNIIPFITIIRKFIRLNITQINRSRQNIHLPTRIIHIIILATSVYLRYVETDKFPDNGYKGDYIFDIAKKIQGIEKLDIFSGVCKDEKHGATTRKRLATVAP
jgi:arginyl-tRNA synthetase